MTILLYLLLTYLSPGFCYGSGFMSSHGMSLFGFASRLISYILNFALCFFLIAIMPDRKLWFSKYGTRTMNRVSCVLVCYASLHVRVVWIFNIYDNSSISLLFTFLGKGRSDDETTLEYAQ